MAGPVGAASGAARALAPAGPAPQGPPRPLGKARHGPLTEGSSETSRSEALMPSSW